MSGIIIGEKALTTQDVVRVARQRAKISLSARAVSKIKQCRTFLEENLAAGKTIYSVNTGWGGAIGHQLSPNQLRDLQEFQVRSHAAGYGKPLPEDQVRAAMVSRINTHAQGYSACRVEVTQKIIELLNRGVTPVVPEKGSVGASGDLAPMAHVALVMLGDGEAYYEGARLSGLQALQRADIAPLRLEARDGLALINGSNFIAGVGALLVNDAARWLSEAEICAAMSVEALIGNLAAFDERIQTIRGFPGAIISARNLRRILDGSPLWHEQARRVQDAYSLRSTPQVVGAARDALTYIHQQIVTELNGAGDNPLFVAADKAVLGGASFQGTPVGLPLDLLTNAITTVSLMSERRLNRLVNPALSEGLPLFLTPQPGIYSGFMTSQYTVDALVVDQRLLSAPASVQSIPASADQEDFVSMGWHAAQRAHQVIDLGWAVLGIEAMAAAQALDLRGTEHGKGIAAAHHAIRMHVPRLQEDRVLSIDQDKMAALMRDGVILKAVEEAVGPLESLSG